MKRLLLYLLVIQSTVLNAQTDKHASQNDYDDVYISRSIAQSVKKDSVNSDLTNIQYCLGSYYKQRQTGLLFTILGGTISTVSIFAINNSPRGREIGSVMGGIVGLTGVVITLDAEKWLKKASVSISPGGIKVNF